MRKVRGAGSKGKRKPALKVGKQFRADMDETALAKRVNNNYHNGVVWVVKVEGEALSEDIPPIEEVQ